MSKRVTATDRSLICKRLLHDGATFHVRAAWVDARPGKGEKYVLLYDPLHRHAWDLTDTIDAGALLVAAQYVDSGFAISVEAAKRIMSGAAARTRTAAPAVVLERARAVPVAEGRAPPPRAGARPLSSPSVTAAAEAAAARRGRVAEANTDTEDIPGGYGTDASEEGDQERHPMDDDDEDDPAPAAAAPAPLAPPAAASDDESGSDVCDEEAFTTDAGWSSRNRRTVLEHDAARADNGDKRFHRDVRGVPTTTPR